MSPETWVKERTILENQKWEFLEESMTCQLRNAHSMKLLLVNPYDPYIRCQYIADRCGESDFDLLLVENRHNIEELDKIKPASAAFQAKVTGVPIPTTFDDLYTPCHIFLSERIKVAKMYQRRKVIAPIAFQIIQRY